MTTTTTTAMRNLVGGHGDDIVPQAPARTGWGAETPSGEPEQTKVSAWASKAEDAAKKARPRSIGAVPPRRRRRR